MKRFISIFAVAALLCQAAVIFAQESDEPSAKSVLDAARAKYWQDKGADASGSAAADSSAAAPDSAPDATAAPVGEADAKVPFTPVLVSFVPGLSAPLGYYDVSLAGGLVGSLVRDVTGAEGAGVFTIARDVKGFQGAGVFNLARTVHGFQDAGVFNIVDGDMTGLQGAGVFNIVHGKVLGLQGAGVFNIAEKVLGPFQAAGVFNLADEIYGFQAAGVFDIAHRVVGGQASGVFNIADNVTGVQIGLVNVAHHIDGVQIGLINIAGNGVDSVGVTYEPSTDYYYAHWQTGTPAFFTVFGFGAPSGAWFQDLSRYVVSVGAGSRSKLFGFNLDLDVSAVQPLGLLPTDQAGWENFGWSAQEGFRPYPSVRLTAGLPLGRHFQLVAGVKADIDVDSLGNRVPEGLKKGSSWQGTIFGEGFTVWPKWFFGVKI